MKKILKKVVPHRVQLLIRNPIEQMVYLGYDWKPKSNQKSILFFTVHKCASTYMDKFFNFLNKKQLGLTRLNMERFLFDANNLDISRYLQNHSVNLFQSRGFCYAPLRDYVDIDHVKDYRVMVMVRDPRDVLVSLYFSHAFSHGMPMDKERKNYMMAVRKRARETGLNEQVLEYLPQFRERYLKYHEFLIEGAGAALLYYEDMVTNFDGWLQQVQNALQIAISPENARELKRIGGFGQSVSENKFAHVRKVTPGDYKEKLTPEFIDEINDSLGEVLDRYQY